MKNLHDVNLFELDSNELMQIEGGMSVGDAVRELIDLLSSSSLFDYLRRKRYFPPRY